MLLFFALIKDVLEQMFWMWIPDPTHFDATYPTSGAATEFSQRCVAAANTLQFSVLLPRAMQLGFNLWAGVGAPFLPNPKTGTERKLGTLKLWSLETVVTLEHLNLQTLVTLTYLKPWNLTAGPGTLEPCNTSNNAILLPCNSRISQILNLRILEPWKSRPLGSMQVAL